MEMTVVWHNKALLQIEKILDHIAKQSPNSANRVANDLILNFEKVIKYPAIFSPDKYKQNNAGLAYSAFELHRIRISYKIEEDRILIVRCRHSSQQPLTY